MLLKCVLLFLLSRYVDSENVNIAGLFEHNEDHEKAFMYAVKHVNDNIQPDEFSLVPITKNEVLEDDPFPALQQTCLLLNLGIVAIFGPRFPSNIDAVQSVCDAKEIPHIITRWNHFSLRNSSEINFYPHPPSLSQAYFEIVMALEWKTFTVFYEDNEGFLRMMGLIQKAKDEGFVVGVQQLDKSHSGNYRPTFNETKISGQKNFVVDCHIDHLTEVLLQFQQVGLMNENYHYFITNLDAHTEELTPFQYAGANITGIRIVHPGKTLTQQISQELYADSVMPEIASWKLKTETAMIIDAVHMFAIALNDIQRESSTSIVNNDNILFCNNTDSWKHGYSIVNSLKTSSYQGLTGLVRFSTDRFRDDFELNLFELREGGITDTGTWNTSTGVSLESSKKHELIPDDESLKNRTFIVITTLTDPYGMLKETYETLIGNDRFEGFGIDLIKKLAEIEGFNYTFILREDKQNGAKTPSGRWTGMIGDLLEHRADLAITDFTITSDREEAVDFTVPFMNLGISILFRKPFTAPPSFFSFADPFALDTWIALAVAFFLVALSLFLIGRLSPDEWTNPYPCIEEPTYLINQFSMSNSIWFVTGSLMCQGSEIAPIGISTRMIAGMWWFFCLLIVASYTANLAAFLATENPVELFKDIQSLYDNAPVHNIKFGAKKNGATEKFFMNAEDGIFKKIGQYMKDHPEDQVAENINGVTKAETELYAFFMESTSIEYTTQRHCDLQQYGGLLDDKGYGIAMRKESPYRKRLSTAILKLQAAGVLDELKRKWWEERRGGGQCTGTTEASDATPLGLKNVEGCFWVTIYGTILAGIVVIMEHLAYIFKVSRKAKISYIEAFKQEFKFFIDFNSNVKPVVSKTSSDKSTSQSVVSNSKSRRSRSRSICIARSRSRSASTYRFRSKSRYPPESESKTKSLRESQNSKVNGTVKSGYPYGFMLSSSMEGVDGSDKI